MTTIFPNTAALAAAKGTTLGQSPWLHIDQAMIDAFAEATGDRQWIHVDPDRCQRQLGRGTIAHGYLVLSLAARFAGEVYRVEQVDRVINYGLDRVRFVSPVPAGSDIRAHFRLLETVPRDDGLRITNEVTIELRHAPKPAMIAHTLALFVPSPK